MGFSMEEKLSSIITELLVSEGRVVELNDTADGAGPINNVL